MQEHDSFEIYWAKHFVGHDKTAISDICNSWDFYEFGQSKQIDLSDYGWEYLEIFYNYGPARFRNLYNLVEHKYVFFGYIEDVSQTAGIYDMILKNPITGSAIHCQIPKEFFAKAKYIPKIGDKITRIEDNAQQNICFYIRKSGIDELVYQINTKSPEYLKVMAAAEKRLKLKNAYKQIVNVDLNRTLTEQELAAVNWHVFYNLLPKKKECVDSAEFVDNATRSIIKIGCIPNILKKFQNRYTSMRLRQLTFAEKIYYIL